MKKLFSTILLFALGGILGYGIVELSYQYSFYMTDVFLLNYLIIILFAVIAFILSIIIHECGHMIFGLISGYKFLSIRFGSIMFIKEDNHIRIKRFTLAGTGGQCLMDPPDLVNGRIPVFLYNMGGCFINVMTAIICECLVLVTAPGTSELFLHLLALISVVTALMNGIPLKSNGIANDGYNSFYLMKDLNAQLAFYKGMKISAFNHKHIRLKDMDEDLFDYNNADLNNPLWHTVAVMKANRELDAHHFDKSQKIIEYILNNHSDIIGVYKHLLINDLIYIKTMNNIDPSYLYTKEHKSMRNALKNIISISRTDYIYHKYITSDNKAMMDAYNMYYKIASSYPYKADLEMEEELMLKEK